MTIGYDINGSGEGIMQDRDRNHLLSNDYAEDRRGVKTSDLTDDQVMEYYNDLLLLDQMLIWRMQVDGWSFRDAIKWKREYAYNGRAIPKPYQLNKTPCKPTSDIL